MDRAIRAVADILHKYPDRVAEAVLVPSSGGVFEVDVDGRRIFSKKELGRHAEPGEVERLFAEATGSAEGR